MSDGIKRAHEGPEDRPGAEYRNVTRVEVINHANSKGRVYTIQNEGISVSVDLQDQGRTLKVFIDKRG